MKNASTEQLVAIIQSTGDRLAFNELFGRYDKKLRYFLYSKSETEIVDDVVQETYVKAFLNFKKFKSQSQFSTWLLRIAFNELLQFKRKVSLFHRLKEHWQNNIYHSNSYIESTAIFMDAQKAIDELSDKQKKVFMYGEILGYSHIEIAKKLELPIGSVKTYMKQAREKIEFEEN